jgi:hypothetical protein
MSSNIWTQCGGISNFRRLQSKPWRVVEAQHLISTLKLVDTLDEQRLLEEMIDRGKPALSRDPAVSRLHFLLFTPFRYPPLRHGSRFGAKNEPGIWYGSEELRTVFAEKAYYRFVFLSGPKVDLSPIAVEQTAFRVDLDSRKGIDLTHPPFDAHRASISSKTSYQISQALGRAMRAEGIEAFRYTSARDRDGGANLALFTPKAFARANPRSPQTWLCISEQKKVSFTQKHAFHAPSAAFEFERSDFEVAGQLPAPAL